jgi:hypothetical protein
MASDSIDIRHRSNGRQSSYFKEKRVTLNVEKNERRDALSVSDEISLSGILKSYHFRLTAQTLVWTLNQNETFTNCPVNPVTEITTSSISKRGDLFGCPAIAVTENRSRLIEMSRISSLIDLALAYGTRHYCKSSGPWRKELILGGPPVRELSSQGHLF